MTFRPSGHALIFAQGRRHAGRRARRLTDIYQALADPTRRIILDELSKREGQTLFELLGRLAMAHGITSSRQAISQHLAVLEEVGLVRTKRQGRTKLHWFDGSPLKQVVTRWPIPKRRSRR